MENNRGNTWTLIWGILAAVAFFLGNGGWGLIFLLFAWVAYD